MKDNNYRSLLFSILVSTTEIALYNPYYFEKILSNFDDLAEAMNLQGFKNSNGRNFKGDTIRKFIERMSDIDKEKMKDNSSPHRPFIDNDYPIMNYCNEYSSRFNYGSRCVD